MTPKQQPTGKNQSAPFARSSVPGVAPQKLFDDALAYHRAGRLREAEQLYRQILTKDPKHSDSLNLLGLIGHQTGNFEGGGALIRQAIHVNGGIALYHNNLANLLKDQKRFDEAVLYYNQAITLQPSFAEAHYNLGLCLQDMRRLDAAAFHYEKAIALKPDLAQAYNNLGNVRKDQGNLDGAVVCYRRALELAPSYAEAHYNLGMALKEYDKLDEAIIYFERALALKPNYADAHNALGVLRKDQNRHADAFAHFRKAIAATPQHAEAHINAAMLHLLTGDLEKGFGAYEWRWKLPLVEPAASVKPLWDGSDLKGKTILLETEQGLGDSLQFIRYAPLVQKKGGRIIVVCPQQLVRLLRNVDGIDQVVGKNEKLPEHDCRASLMSLPLLFGTRLETIPASVPYISAPESTVFAGRMGSYPGLKIGLVWAGNPRADHADAHAVDRRRSMTLAQFVPLAKIPGVHFFSLQKGTPADQAKTPPAGLEIIDWMDEVHDFADTAALVRHLDLVIGVDTSVIHLAGAIGKPVWVLSRLNGCWRWLLNRDDNPWYPTLRLFRQSQAGDWDGVMTQVKAALLNLKP